MVNRTPLMVPMKVPRLRRDRFIVARPVPRTVAISSWALLAIAAIDSVILLVGAPSFANESSLPTGLIVFGTVAVLAFSVFTAALALLLRRGVNWARVVLTVSATLLVASMLASPSAYVIDGLQQARVLIENLVTLAATVLLWLPTSKVFFRTVGSDRRLHRSRRFRQ